MVIIRPGRIEQQKQKQQQQQEKQQKQQEQQQQVALERMFKVPGSSPPQAPTPGDMAAGKRKWQEAFKGEANPSVPAPAPANRPPQLTIFYAGAVNVYENVPENMVRALMTLAAAKSSKPAGLLDLHRSSSSNISQLKNNNNNNNKNKNNNKSVPNNNNNNIPNNNNVPKNNNRNGSVGSSSSFSFPVLETTSTNLSLSSSYRAATEERSGSVPQPTSEQSASAAQPSAPAASASGPPSVAIRSMASRTRMQMLPTGLPQARRASIQRFLQKRKHKQVNNDEEDDDPAAMAVLSTAEMKPTSDAPSAAQVPHFLTRS